MLLSVWLRLEGEAGDLDFSTLGFQGMDLGFDLVNCFGFLGFWGF